VGHHIIAEIAKGYVDKSVRDSIEKYFGTMTWEAASTWMDDVRGNKEYDYLKQWHYVDFEKNGHYDSIIANGNNVVNQLQKAISNLNNKQQLTKEQIIFNLKVLFHLIGDLHQPLHVGYASDKGGNNIKVWLNNKEVSLHHVWDTGIIEFKNVSFSAINDNLLKLAVDSIIKIQEGNVVQWMNESRGFLSAVYDYTTTLNSDYINNSNKIIETRLLFAGLRLGKILNNIFKK